MGTTERALRAGRELTDAEIGVLRDVTVSSAPPDEPSLYTAAVDRSHPAALTDGVRVPPAEGGAGLTRDGAAASAIGEGVERYSASIYRESDLRTATDADLDSAVDPSAVRNFSQRQRECEAVPSSLYEDGDELRWVEGERLDDGAPTHLPAQLVYLSYDTSDEPFVRAPISTGLAAAFDRDTAVRRGLLEVVERDAFMIHYLAKSPLPRLRLDDPPDAVATLTDRLDRAGIEWYLLDARTDIGLPVVVSVLVDRHGTPEVSVAAAASGSAVDAVQSALVEAIQTRFYQRYLRRTTDKAEQPPEQFHRESRLLAWGDSGAADGLTFWTESDEALSLTALAEAADTDDVRATVQRKWDLYAADVTAPDVARTGFRVVRVVAPGAQPLYLHERHRYWGMERLASVPVECGHRETPPTHGDLNERPHPFP